MNYPAPTDNPEPPWLPFLAVAILVGVALYVAAVLAWATR